MSDEEVPYADELVGIVIMGANRPKARRQTIHLYWWKGLHPAGTLNEWEAVETFWAWKKGRK